MKNKSFRTILLHGIALAIPVGLVAYVVLHFLHMFEDWAAPLSRKLHIEHLFGEITATVLAALALLLICFLFGVLMMIPAVSRGHLKLEDLILRLVPSLNQFKLIADEQLQMEHATNSWKPVMIIKEDEFTPAFIIEETDQWATMVVIKAPGSDPEDIFVVKKSTIVYKEVSMTDLKKATRLFGRGYIALVEKILNSQTPAT